MARVHKKRRVVPPAKRATTRVSRPRALIRPTRAIPRKTSLFLYVQAGGRCEFDGCNKYLLEHGPTAKPGNFAEKAHIWAFNEGGPRGRGAGRPKNINALSNLMLLCKDCHHLVDVERPQDYPMEVLRKFKEDHEARIYQLTDLAKDRDTIPLVLKGLVAGRRIDISDEEMQAAVAPNYLRRREKIDIDLTSLPDSADPSYWDAARAVIDQKVDELGRLEPRPNRTLRVSVFAIAPIPLLVYLGSRLTDKQAVDLYQRQRAPETWNWKEDAGSATFVSRRLAQDGEPVALLVNVSGTNTAEQVRGKLGLCTIYELAIENQAATPLVLKTRGDLERFTAEYVRMLGMIRLAHPNLATLNLFPAVPTPIAVTLGRTRLPKVDPALLIFDRDSRAGGFVPTLEVRGVGI